MVYNVEEPDNQNEKIYKEIRKLLETEEIVMKDYN
jgi:hypothetical protein